MPLKNINSNGTIFYQGPSQLDGAPIVAIATGLTKATSNRKTGFMIQTWIIRSDTHPQEALVAGKDASVCGNCKFRPKNGHRICYVNPMTIGQIYQQYHLGKYAQGLPPYFHLGVRIGSYGDPTAVPIKIWTEIVKAAPYHTAYTQQWRNPQFTEFRNFCMASVSSALEAAEAQALGWRTYRVCSSGGLLEPHEIWCPAEKADGSVTCSQCRLCYGTSKQKNIVIPVHGNAKHFFN